MGPLRRFEGRYRYLHHWISTRGSNGRYPRECCRSRSDRYRTPRCQRRTWTPSAPDANDPHGESRHARRNRRRRVVVALASCLLHHGCDSRDWWGKINASKEAGGRNDNPNFVMLSEELNTAKRPSLCSRSIPAHTALPEVAIPGLRSE